MGFQVYIIYSASLDLFYKGQTGDLKDRLNRHNQGWEKATQNGVPWTLIWSTEKTTREQAVELESKLKNLSRNKLIRFMLKYKEGVAGTDAALLLAGWSAC